MRHPNFGKVGITAVVLAGAGAVQAHHSTAQFDLTKLATVQGTVRQFQWTNPHVWIQLTVNDEAGQPVEWTIEGPNPAGLARVGWHSNTVKVGDKITVVINPLRTAGRGGFMQSVTLMDGRTLGQTDVQKKRIEDAAAAGSGVQSSNK